MASDQSKADSYVVSFIGYSIFQAEDQAFAQRQVDYVMGDNPMNGMSSIKLRRTELTKSGLHGWYASQFAPEPALSTGVWR